MIILHLIPFLSGGGAERQLGYLAAELAHTGYDVHIAYTNDGPDRPELRGVKLHQLKVRSNYSPFLVWQLIKLIRHIKPDVIQTWIVQMDILGGILAKAYGIPWVFREPSSALAYLPGWKNRLRFLMGRYANAVVSNSKGGDDYWNKRIPPERRYVILNALPSYQSDNAGPTLPDGLDKTEMPTILYVGRIIAYKGLNALLKALTIVNKEHKVMTILCGEGPDICEMEALRHKLGLDGNVHFTGHLKSSQILELMKKANVFVSLSSFEGCPNAVMEAAACGCPLILSDIPAHREILDTSCSHFVDPSNIQQIAATIIETLSDTDSSNNCAIAAKTKSQEWSISKMAHNYERVYEEVI